MLTSLKKQCPKVVKGFNVLSHARDIWASRTKLYPSLALFIGWFSLTALVDWSGLLDAYGLSPFVSLSLMPLFMLVSLAYELFVSGTDSDSRGSYLIAFARVAKSVLLVFLCSILLGICCVPAVYAFDLICSGQTWHLRLFGCGLGVLIVYVGMHVAFELLGLGTCASGFILQGKSVRDALSRGRLLFAKHWAYLLALHILYSILQWLLVFFLGSFVYGYHAFFALIGLLYAFLVFSYHKRVSRLPLR